MENMWYISLVIYLYPQYAVLAICTVFLVAERTTILAYVSFIEREE
jgi:hypothetical protein